MTPHLTPEVQLALDRGEPWRAKELLQGRLGTYSIEAYAQYGALLLQLRELPEPGRYLFLAGETAPYSSEAISVYLKRHGAGSWRALAASFPRAVRNTPILTLPESVQSALRERGLRFPDLAPTSSLNAVGKRVPSKPTPQQQVQAVSCAVVGLLALACMIVGASVLISRVFHFFGP